MEFVCKDTDGDWFFQDGEYRRLNGAELRGKISGEQLPDPFLLEQSYKKLNPEARSPTPATFALWEHWNNKKAA